MVTPQNVLDSLDAMNTAFSNYSAKSQSLQTSQGIVTADQATLMSATNIAMGANTAKMAALMDYQMATANLVAIQMNGTQQQIADAQADVNAKHIIYDGKANDYTNAYGAQVIAQNDLTTAQNNVATDTANLATAKTASNTALDTLVGSCIQTWKLN